MTSQVIMEDGSESPLSDHLREVHQKGTRGLNDEYLGNLHRALHERDREPQPEHEHPDDDTEYAELGQDAEDETPISA